MEKANLKTVEKMLNGWLYEMDERYFNDNNAFFKYTSTANYEYISFGDIYIDDFEDVDDTEPSIVSPDDFVYEIAKSRFRKALARICEMIYSKEDNLKIKTDISRS